MVIFRTFLADRIFFWAEDLPGKGRFYPREQGGFIPGQTQHDWNMKTWSGQSQFFFGNGHCFFEMDKSLKMDGNQTKICPGQKFVTNEYPGIDRYPQLRIAPFTTG